MEITRERREQLLAGIHPAVSAEKGAWCPDVRSAPAWVQERVVEIRAAQADNRPVPPPTRSWIAGAERRMLEQAQRAVRFVKRVSKITLSEARTRARSTG